MTGTDTEALMRCLEKRNRPHGPCIRYDFRNRLAAQPLHSEHSAPPASVNTSQAGASYPSAANRFSSIETPNPGVVGQTIVPSTISG